MFFVPGFGQMKRQTNMGSVGVTASTFGTSVTTGASSSTKGTTVELISSTNFESYLVHVVACCGSSNTGVADSACLDIMIGSATESVLIADLLAGGAPLWIGGSEYGSKNWLFPLLIPSGSRLSARIAGSRTSTSYRIGIAVFGGCGVPPWQVGTRVTTYGIGTVPSGTSITAGNGAEGSWTQITASTTEEHSCVMPSFQCSTGESSFLSRHISVDIGVGSATESEIGGAYDYHTDTIETMDGPALAFPTFQRIPSGTRLVMRASCNAAPDSYDGALHCIS